MNPLTKSFAKEILNANADKIRSLAADPAKQRAATKALFIKARQHPVISQSNINPSAEATARMDKAIKDWDEYAMQPLEQGRGPNEITLEMRKEQPWSVKRAIRDVELESYGVDTGRELPAGDWKLGFGADPVEDVRAVLSEHFGKPVKVIQDGLDIIYIDPVEQRMVKANMGMGAKAGFGLPMGADIASSFIGGPQGGLMKKIVTEATGSAVFTTFGEGIRLGIGKALGVHDLSIDEMATRAAKVGGEAGALTGATGTLVAGIKGAMNYANKGFFTVEEAKQLGLSAEDAEEVIESVNQMLKESGSDKKIVGTLGQKANDANTESFEMDLRKSQEYAQDFRVRDQSDQAALAEASENLAKPVDVPDGKPIQEVARDRTIDRQRRVDDILGSQAEELQARLDDIPSVSDGYVGEAVGSKLSEDAAMVKERVNEAYFALEEAGGYNPTTEAYGIEIPYGPNVEQVRDIASRRAGTAQTSLARGQSQSLLTGKKFKIVDGKKVDAEGADLGDYINEIKRIRKAINKDFGMQSTKDLLKLEHALREDMTLGLVKAGREDLIPLVEAAEEAAAQYNAEYKRGIVGMLLDKNEFGIRKISDQKMISKLIGSGKEMSARFYEAIADDPGLVQLWKNGIADNWKQTAFNAKGKFNRQQSQRWFKKNESMLSEFFTPDEIQKMRYTGTLAERVEASAKELDKFVENANKKWGSGALKGQDPENLVRFITSDTGSFMTSTGQQSKTAISKIRYVRNMVKKHPAAWARLQNDFRQNVYDTITDPKTGLIDVNKIVKWTGDGRNAAIVAEVMGSKYLDDLVTIAETAKILSKPMKQLNAEQQARGWIQSVRAAIAPPLTARGRAFTAGITFYNVASQKKLAKAVLDPTNIAEVAKLAQHSTMTRRVAEKAVSLGFMLPGQGDPIPGVGAEE